MGRTKSSDRWLREHFNDAYVEQAQRQGYRSRSLFKLSEIDDRDHLLKPGMSVVDLGAAPGGWSQYCAERLGGHGHVVALDWLAMDALADVTTIQADFTDDEALARLESELGHRPADLVLSDMAPNISGHKAVDQPRAMHLMELALEFVDRALKPGGDFLVKAFQGEGFDAYRRGLKERFARVQTRKPGASRDRSAEMYLLARNLHS